MNFLSCPAFHEIDGVPTVQELRDAEESLKCDKVSGPDGIPAEVFQCGGEGRLSHLIIFLLKCWNVDEVPQQ